ncbi:ATPase H(+)-transporting accessory protein 2-like [Bactrocera neohumeralis]|uniref:ATPase H(+)-transporting accessory protein 2-like n=1 Tax=Bactrocera neohumeralis TaxID=98809 RepID=UPI0021666486|nr:ATPase H(+)-transporting accessory protein 2-like [Bactrocera neohumeralis]
MGNIWIILGFLIKLMSIVVADDFIPMSYPEGLAFEETAVPIPIKQVKHILMAIVGESASAGAEFYAMSIKNVFKMPKLALVVTAKLNSTADYSVLGTIVKYSVEGRIPGTSLRNILNFEKSSTNLEFYKTSKNMEYEYLKKMLTADRAPGVAEMVPELQNLLTTDVIEKLGVDIKVKNFVGLHFWNKKTALDFSKLSDVFAKLKDLWKDNFFCILTYGPDLEALEAVGQNVSTIITVDPMDHKHYNIPPRYDENYAIIFNIILWFMVAFSLSIYAIILALMNMDPGRNSIIYRMTATRSKKDI